MFSGTTCISVVFDKSTLICANTGDSRAIMGCRNNAGVWSCTELSWDHKPEEIDEADRVKSMNGRIE